MHKLTLFSVRGSWVRVILSCP